MGYSRLARRELHLIYNQSCWASSSSSASKVSGCLFVAPSVEFQSHTHTHTHTHTLSLSLSLTGLKVLHRLEDY
jgi:hypothetical protein